ncbi:hypothetical protein PFJ87_03g01430 [Encephalitozoon hellem]|uniref:Uncharacterized protein n=1 Tax=Encephalitozoon hellem TaxID=27973 RepID=A0ABY8CHD1_ENCHE|nr:hypothetical protein PFJ87_03g01430 [Encephalitozoon hellem]
MNCAVDIQEKEQDSNRFLIKSNNKQKLRNIMIYFYIAILASTTNSWVNIFSEILADETKDIICLVVSWIFASLPCINMVTELLSSIWNLVMKDIEKENVLKCVKALFDFVVILHILNESRRVPTYRVKQETTPKIVIASYFLLMSQRITDDLNSSTITVIVTSVMMILGMNVIRKEKFGYLKSSMKHFIDFLVYCFSSSTQRRVIPYLGNIIPTLLIGYLIILASGILIYLEDRLVKCIVLPRDRLLFAYGIILFMLALYISKEGEDMAIDIVKNATSRWSIAHQRASSFLFSFFDKN